MKSKFLFFFSSPCNHLGCWLFRAEVLFLQRFQSLFSHGVRNITLFIRLECSGRSEGNINLI